jgi:Activator of Hsp90 ATPase homolog 1-like protein
VEELDPPRRVVHGWRSVYDPGMEAESRVTWEIEPQDGGHCLLTVSHDQLEGAPTTSSCGPCSRTPSSRLAATRSSSTSASRPPIDRDAHGAASDLEELVLDDEAGAEAA